MEGQETNAGLAGDAMPPSIPVVTAKPKPVKPSLGDVLAKQATGAVLTPQERGVLGAAKRKSMGGFKFTPAPESNLLDVEPISQPAPAQAPKPVASVAAKTDAASDNLLLKADEQPAVSPVPVVDANFGAERCKLAAEAICDSIDNGGQLWVGWEAEKAGGNQQTQARYEAAVALQPRNRKLMVDGSEPVVRFLCRWFKCEPEQLEDALKGSGFAAGLISHGLVVGSAIKSIRQSKVERAAQPEQPTPAKP